MTGDPGLIGVGLVGTALSKRLLAAGCRVTGFDISTAQLDNLVRLGGTTAPSPAAVAAATPRMILSLPTSAVSCFVLEEMAPCLASGAIVIRPACSRAMDTKGHKMVAGDFSIESRVSQHLKDMRLVFESGGRVGANLPLSSVHRALLEKAEAVEFGAADNSAVIKTFAKKHTR